MTPDHLCLALDVPTAALAADWVARTRGQIGTYKIGLELFAAEGPEVVDQVRRAGARRIFLDLKLHDIPNTVGSTVAALGHLGVDLLTVHSGGGGEMLARAVSAAEPAGTQILAVTVLTSLDAMDLAAIGVTGVSGQLVEARARLALAEGVPGLVCSPREVASLRARFGDQPYLVTPGIRLPGEAVGDQRRVATPTAALAAGADLLVLGRTIRDADDPEQTLATLLEGHAE